MDSNVSQSGAAGAPVVGEAQAQPSGVTPEMQAQIDAAMAALGPDPRSHQAQQAHQAHQGAQHGPKPSAPPVRATQAIKGPRVVTAGREHRTGVVVSVGPTDVFLEFGPRELGFVPRLQFSDDDLPKAGDQLAVVIDRYEASESLFVCSRPGAVRKADWEFLEPGQVVEAKVTGVNKGGLELEVGGHAAFMPAGQVSTDRIPDLSVFVGQKLTCVVQRVDRRGRGNIVLSRRDLLAKEREEKAAKLRATLAEGQVVDGTVRKIMAFGAFVDLGGVDGLVHISDLTHDRAGHGERFVERYVKEGEAVKVRVLKLDWEGGRISLGLKQAQADPFAAAANEIKEGAEVSGRVTKILEFGAFLEIAPGVEGLVHISELAWRRVGSVGEVLKADEIVRAKVLRIDKDSRRIALSVKALQEPPKVDAKARKERVGPTAEEILKETPALRRLREKFGKQGFKGGLS